MTKNFEILDHCETPLGPLILRRRRILSLGGSEVYEVKLGDEYLMSSLFHQVEVALADLGLAALNERKDLEVVVGGLGLGYTAVAALKNPNVKSLLVIDYLESVIRWHRQGLVPLGPQLTGDSRCRFVHLDFFAAANAPETGFDPENPGRRFHAILLDIDHSPQKLLHSNHGAFYEYKGLQTLSEHLHPGGVFALWSDDPPDDDFLRRLNQVFTARAEIVTFHNPLLERDSASTVYIAVKADRNA